MYVFDKDSFGLKKLALLIYQEGFLHSLRSDSTFTVMYYVIRMKDGEWLFLLLARTIVFLLKMESLIFILLWRKSFIFFGEIRRLTRLYIYFYFLRYSDVRHGFFLCRNWKKRTRFYVPAEKPAVVRPSPINFIFTIFVNLFLLKKSHFYENGNI